MDPDAARHSAGARRRAQCQDALPVGLPTVGQLRGARPRCAVALNSGARMDSLVQSKSSAEVRASSTGTSATAPSMLVV
eukprot:CAMPEP_0175381040 /NCGR_PEP_ID=MMETSP0095-20121207/26621_1 /TAXON_ID=311494 /ORGANISM="Alexandrium monilatum, Strain CCMP3105" /LENGTH=78 /DNA_ID=CAMNT_0016679413 /DNA_START=78 /DNA_END=311 /DNA_ORIENTATION=-